MIKAPSFGHRDGFYLKSKLQEHSAKLLSAASFSQNLENHLWVGADYVTKPLSEVFGPAAAFVGLIKTCKDLK